jgi:ribonuclease HI
MAKHKYYVVWKGRKPGVYASWAACRAQIHGVADASFKSFPNKTMAEAAYRGEFTGVAAPETETEPDWNSWCVDAACEGNPGVMEYRCVEATGGAVIFHEGPFQNGTNNIGEFLAVVHALALQQKKNLRIPIYSDSRTALAWLRKKKVGSKLPREPKTEALWAMVDRAVIWLKGHEVHVPVRKWQTESWGEIPADFGRK